MIDHTTDTSYAYLQNVRNSVYQVQRENFPYPVVKTYRYDSFGRIISETGTLGNPFAYTGREWEPDLGLYYYRARWYDPAVGRFLSEDPIGFSAGDPNIFRYVGNNPVNFVDPFGLWTIFGSIGLRGTSPIGLSGETGTRGIFGTYDDTYDLALEAYAQAFPGAGLSFGKGAQAGFFTGDVCEFRKATEIGLDTIFGGFSIIIGEGGNFGVSFSGPAPFAGGYVKPPNLTGEVKIDLIDFISRPAY